MNGLTIEASVVLYTTCLLVLAEGTLEQLTETKTHCGNVTGKAEESTPDKTELYQCVECLYQQNCMADNLCRLGTSGDTCEKCVRDYHRVGSCCVRCPSLPWSTVSFGVYFLILIGAVFYHGLTDSVCTKMKLLSHFLQTVLLTLHMKIAWPDQLLEILSIVNFGKFNSDIVYPECLFSSWSSLSAHYLEWITSICIPVLTIVLGKFLDASMKQIINIKNSKTLESCTESLQRPWQKRTSIRRLVVTVIMIMYMPSTLSCIRTFLCSDTIPKLLVLDHSTNVFLLDNAVSCDTFVFQSIHFFATVYLVLFGLLLPPMLIFFTLRQRKWDLLNSKWNLYGPVYEAYKERFCFWGAFPLLRMLISIVITEAYPVSAFVQIVTQLGMSVVYLLTVIAFRPYRSCYWVHPNFNVHIFFEIVSNLAVCLLQAVGLSIVLNLYQESTDLAAAGCVCVVVVIWIVLMLAMICESKSHVELTLVEAVSSSEPSRPQRSRKGIFQLFKKAKIEPDHKLVEKVQENKARLNF